MLLYLTTMPLQEYPMPPISCSCFWRCGCVMGRLTHPIAGRFSEGAGGEKGGRKRWGHAQLRYKCVSLPHWPLDSDPAKASAPTGPIWLSVRHPRTCPPNVRDGFWQKPSEQPLGGRAHRRNARVGHCQLARIGTLSAGPYQQRPAWYSSGHGQVTQHGVS